MRKSTKNQLSPASSVHTETELLTGLLPNILKALTVIVYLFPGSSPVIVWLIEVLVTEIVPLLTSEQPTDGPLCHISTNLVTKVPLGISPLIVMVVVVAINVLRTGAIGAAY